MVTRTASNLEDSSMDLDQHEMTDTQPLLPILRRTQSLEEPPPLNGSFKQPPPPSQTPLRQSHHRSLRQKHVSGTVNKKTNTGKLTPASAKRRRAYQKQSPSQHIVPLKASRDAMATRVTSVQQLDESPVRSGTLFPLPKVSIGTGRKTTPLTTTPFTEYNANDDNNNMESSNESTTPFRFTSFPASLPRIQQQQQTQEAESDTVLRKRTRRNNKEALNNSLSSEETPLGYSDDESYQSSLIGTPVVRTRLNFNAAAIASPTKTTKTQETDSYMPNALLKKSGSGDDQHTTSTAGLTPSRSGVWEARVTEYPGTPREVQLHFQLEANQCSPIPGIPEEESQASSRSRGHNKPLNESLTSTASGSQARRLRPLPDMNAFDGDLSSSREHSSREDAPELVCPPTPIRTPAWAHADNSVFRNVAKFHRNNSLIANKVLAKCSVKALDGRASLESSILEEDSYNISRSTHGPDTSSGSHDNSLLLSSPERIPVGLPSNHAIKGDADWLKSNGSPTFGSRTGLKSISVDNVTTVSLVNTFETIAILGSGAFADVYKVRSKVDGQLYAVKKNRRQFRGKRDREKALAEVKYMQRLQSELNVNGQKASYSLYLIFFYQAWQEDGFFHCQTELCCRDSCRQLIDSLRSRWPVASSRYRSLGRLPQNNVEGMRGRLLPETTIWKIFHDITAGLSHIHSHGLVHNDIKPSNIFFITHPRFGAMCKIGDFGLTGEAGVPVDGQEGDQRYMAPELLSSDFHEFSSDVFSLGLTLYELAADVSFDVPHEGPRWHDIRSETHQPVIPFSRSRTLVDIIRQMMHPRCEHRPNVDTILANPRVCDAGMKRDIFLQDYLHDVEVFDRLEEERLRSINSNDDQTPQMPSRLRVCSPPAGSMLPIAPDLYSPPASSSANRF